MISILILLRDAREKLFIGDFKFNLKRLLSNKRCHLHFEAFTKLFSVALLLEFLLVVIVKVMNESPIF